ncbi:MAG: hypothetical protein R3D51_06440 [Hyphomicrobiaceae bacterium]
MNSQFLYRVYGVTLGSDMALSLPTAPAGAAAYSQLDSGDATDFERIRDSLPPPTDEWGQVSVLGDGSIYMRWNDWLEFVVSPDGRRISYHALCPGPPHAFEAYLANFAVSAAMIQHGEEPLHSTVVEWKGRGFGLTGPSGAGKSSLAAHLLTRGSRLVTDDMLRLTFDGSQAFAQPGPLRLKLNADTVPIYSGALAYRGEWSPDAGKFLFEPVDATEPHEGVQISALFWLERPGHDDAADNTITLERLSGLDLFAVICASTMNSRVHTPQRLQRQMEFAKKIGDSLPVYRLTYPRRHDLLDEVVHKIESALP